MLVELQRFSADYPRLAAVFAGLLGACVGSFLNVCIHRMPKGESVVTPASRCACGQPIPFWFNLPVVGWLVLRGRARCCGGEISLRYPLVELITALLFVSAWTLLPGPKVAAAFVFLPLLILLAGCDLDDMTVPDGPNFTLVGAGLFLSVLLPSLHGHTGNEGMPVLDRLLALSDSLVGIAVGTALVWWIRTIGSVLAGREAMGEADIILCAGVGAFCGWQGALFCLFGGSIIGVITALPGLISAKFIKGEEYAGVVPFVPSMAAAGALWFFRGPELVTGWHHWVNG
jgi:leader peptidase (prepilin peptidase)/N-methyltransferase